MSEACTFCAQPATMTNGLGEPVCADDRLRHWHDHDGGMWDRYAEPEDPTNVHAGRGPL